MTTEQVVQKRVNLTVNGVAHVEGNRGSQWEIQVKYPFSQYPTKQWVDKDGFNTEPVVGQTYPCIILRGDISTKKETDEEYDGTLDWMWRWRITEWDTKSEVPAAAPATGHAAAPKQQGIIPVVLPADDYQTSEQRRQHSIERQVVFKAAVDISLGFLAAEAGKDPQLSPQVEASHVADLAAELWPVLQNIGQDSPPAAPDAPRSHVERTDGSDDAEVDDLLTPATPNPGLARRPVDPNEGQQEPPRDAEERR